MNEEMLFEVEAEDYIANWMEILLEKHGVDYEYELTVTQVEEEIEEELEVIANERMWCNEDNVAIHEAYVEYLKELLYQID